MSNLSQSEKDARSLVFIVVVIFLMALAFLLTSCQGPSGNTIVGPKGETGSPGLNGLDAQPCTAFKTGSVTTIQCPDEAPVAINDGLNGAPGTVITPVQFCAGVTPTYASIFPEFGLIISGQMFGVYSQNDGFLAVLPPGVYNSNAIGSACTFTINPNLSISN